MNKHHAFSFALVLLSGMAIAGIYRHDKKESDYVALGAQTQFDCVGKTFRNGEWNGSCVLISDRYVLSAAHIFILADYRDRTVKVEGATMIVNEAYNKRIGNAADYSVAFNGKQYKCKTLTVYPHYLDSATKNGLDIALLELEEPVAGTSPAVINTGYNELHADVTGIGWGTYGPANKLSEIVRNDPKKLAGENVIDSIGGYILNDKPTTLFCDFDCATDTSSNKMGSPIPRELEYIGGGGDSGGGLFMRTETGWVLAGIYHSNPMNIAQMIKTGYYGQIMSWMRVSVFADWIRENAH